MVNTRNTPAVSEGISPLQTRLIGKCPILKALAEKDVVDWLSQWEEYARNNPGVRPTAKIAGSILRDIHANGVAVGDELTHLQNYLTERDELRQRTFLRTLRNNLHWTPDPQADHHKLIDRLFTQAYRILQGVDVTSDKILRRTVMRAIIAVLPKDYLYDEKLLDEEIFCGEVDTLDALKQKVKDKADYASLAEKQRKK